MNNEKIEPGTEAPEAQKETAERQDGSPSNAPQKSPDYFGAAKKRGGGGRRLNSVPLWILAGIVGILVVGVSYTFYSRTAQSAERPQTQQQTPPVAKSAKPPVDPPSGPSYAGAHPDTPPPPPPGAGAGSGPGDGSAQPDDPQQMQHSAAYQSRMQTIDRVDEKNLADMQAALGADGSVLSFGNRGGRTQQVAQNDVSETPGGADRMQKYLSGATTAGGGLMGAGDSGMAAENRQDQKRAFLAETPDADTYLAAKRKAAIAASQEVKAGTIIPGVMISGLNSDLPGQIIGQVREAVYDSATGTQLLIPAGSRLVGTYDSSVTLGQERVLVGWNRIIYPDGSSLSLNKMPGADVIGYAGFNDKVNNHYWRIFGNGLMLSIFSAGIQLSQPQATNGQNYSASQIVAGSLGQQLGQIGMQMAQRNMNIQPTLEIRPGYEFNVMVTKDIVLPTWRGHPMATHP